MATKVDDSTFVDTNTLVYATVPSAPLHGIAGAAVTELRESGGMIWISRQVIREYLAVMTRSQIFAQPPSVQSLLEQIKAFEGWFRVADDNAAVTEQLVALLKAVPMAGKQIHDANIVATMLTYRVSRLSTNNVEDFLRFRDFIVVVPLRPNR